MNSYVVLAALIIFLCGCENVYIPRAYTYGVITINGTAASDDFDHYNMSIMNLEDEIINTKGIYLTDGDAQVNGSALAQIDTSYFRDGYYLVRLYVYDRAGMFSEDRLHLKIDNLVLTEADNQVNEEIKILNITGRLTGAQYNNISLRYTPSGTDEWSDFGVSYAATSNFNITGGIIATINVSHINVTGKFDLNITVNNSQGFVESQKSFFFVSNTDIYEYDDSYLNATEILTNNTPQEHSIHSANDSDYISFNASYMWGYNITLSSPDGRYAMHLVDPNGTDMFSKGVAINPNSLKRASLLWYSPVNATYYIKVYSWCDEYGRLYNITVDSVSGLYNNTVNLTDASDGNKDGNVELSWTNVSTNPFGRYIVYRSEQEFDQSTYKSTTNLWSTYDLSFKDTWVRHNQSYWYAVVYMDEFGRDAANISQVYHVIPNDTIAPKNTYSYSLINRSGDRVEIQLYSVNQDLNQNTEQNVTYKVWFDININQSQKLVNDTFRYSRSYNTSYFYWEPVQLCYGPCNIYFAFTTMDDAGNENLSIDPARVKNITLTFPAYVPGTTTTTRKSSGSGGGGGRGGIIAGPPQGSSSPAPGIFRRIWYSLRHGESDVDDILLPVSHISVYLTDTSPELNLTLKIVPDAGVQASFRDIYAYFWAGMSKGSTIDSSHFELRINNSWIGGRDISLYTYSDSWIRLNISKGRTDSGYTYFTSDYPLSGYFAIVSDEIAELAAPGQEEAPIAVKAPEVAPNEPLPGTGRTTPSEEQAKEIKKRSIVPAISIITVTALIYAFMIYKGANRLRKTEPDRATQHSETAQLQAQPQKKTVLLAGQKPAKPGVPDKLVEYVRQAKASGYSNEDIMYILLKHNWTDEEIDEAIVKSQL